MLVVLDDLPCAPTGVVVSAPVSTVTHTAACRFGLAAPLVTVIVMPADEATTAVQVATCPSAVGESGRLPMSHDVYVRWAPRLSVMVGLPGSVGSMVFALYRMSRTDPD